MHNKHRRPHHRPPLCAPLKPERKFDYRFVLLYGDKPVGCIKGYSADDSGKIDEVIINICGMKNTFHIESKITKCEMKDFLRLAMSPIFTETFFGSKIYMAGFNEGRQLFCSLSNEQRDYVESSYYDEIKILEGSEDIEDDFDLDIYPDNYEEDNEKSAPSISNDGGESNGNSNNNNEDNTITDEIDETGNGADFVLDQIQLPEKEEHLFSQPYQPIVRLFIEDKEYGVLLDIDITGFIDAHKPHHHKPHKQEFDENPEDDMIQDDNEDDGIDHTFLKTFR